MCVRARERGRTQCVPSLCIRTVNVYVYQVNDSLLILPPSIPLFRSCLLIRYLSSEQCNDNDHITQVKAKLNLVDLAGSERVKNTQSAGVRLKEAGSINSSLSTFGEASRGRVQGTWGQAGEGSGRKGQTYILTQKSVNLLHPCTAVSNAFLLLL